MHDWFLVFNLWFKAERFLSAIDDIFLCFFLLWLPRSLCRFFSIIGYSCSLDDFLKIRAIGNSRGVSKILYSHQNWFEIFQASESDHPQLSERLARFDDDPYLDDSILEKLRNAISSKPFNRGWCDGVDANRNFDFQWGKEGSSRHPCSGTYVGRKPFSEPEAKALADFALSKTGDIAMYATLHAYSQMWLIPWGKF